MCLLGAVNGDAQDGFLTKVGAGGFPNRGIEPASFVSGELSVAGCSDPHVLAVAEFPHPLGKAVSAAEDEPCARTAFTRAS